MRRETSKYVFSFTEGNGKDKKLLGGKGANLCEMTQIGLNVPPGFIISTEACLQYLDADNNQLPDGIMEEVREQIRAVEKATGKGFGDKENPLLVSVRSGSPLSMPGMMDTILNLGLNAATLEGEIINTHDERFAYDAYRRFIQLFGKVAMNVPDESFDACFLAIKQRTQITQDASMTTADLKSVCDDFLNIFQKHTGRAFPEDPYEQLEIAIKAVFRSWMGKRAIDYRREFNITPDMANGTAVNICAMVFGNRGNNSATGVGFTRNPGTGENKLFGEYLVNAQGEDIVAGIRTPEPIDNLANEMPEMARQLEELRQRLENHYHEVQDFEFTIECGKLYCLQTRNGKMNAAAMVRTSVEMVEENLIDKKQALLRINPEHLEQMLYPRLDPANKTKSIAQGLPASPGAAWGHAIFDADRAENEGNKGRKVILVREETKPEDIHGFFASEGILTSRGGKTSHAAVVARGMGKPCIAGAEDITVDTDVREAYIGNQTIRENDIITLDGSTGNIYLGQIPTIEADFSYELNRLLNWADDVAKLDVLANADTAQDASRALKYGAKGIGLCRTERMFNDTARLPIVIDMIVADTPEERQAALNNLRPIQREDFKNLFETMSPYPVTIRLLDPPIHEFLPSELQLRDELKYLYHLRESIYGIEVFNNTKPLLQNDPSETSGYAETRINVHDIEEVIKKKEIILKKVRTLYETNPMLGHRGVRLGITFPEIYEMQIQAILEAAADCVHKGIDIHPKIKIPQVCMAEEVVFVKNIVAKISKQVEKEFGNSPKFQLGTMIEVVRACVQAGSLAKESDFFSFGTNDLTQATFSFSREDAENKFLPTYNDNGILPNNPFEVLDTKGVGKLMKLAIEQGRTQKSGLLIGICGEHGAHPDSIHFCHRIGLNYVSCSAPRVPVARLTAAHAALSGKP